jgi:hypothetical protein
MLSNIMLFIDPFLGNDRGIVKYTAAVTGNGFENRHVCNAGVA